MNEDRRELWKLNEKLTRLLEPRVETEWRWCFLDSADNTWVEFELYRKPNEPFPTEEGESIKRLPCVPVCDYMEPLTDFAGSFEGMGKLIEAMIEKGFHLLDVRHREDYAVAFSGYDRAFATENADTLPEAVARAGLAAMESISLAEF